MGPTPAPPPPLGHIPRPGFQHPRFPTIGQREPQGTQRSQIDTRAPINPAIGNRILDVTAPGRSTQTAAGGLLSGLMTPSNAGDASRAAFSRATADTTKNSLRNEIAELNQATQTQAEKSRGEDVLAQRQSIMDNFRADKMFHVFGADIAYDYAKKIDELAAYYRREKKNSQAMVTASLLRMVGGLI